MSSKIRWKVHVRGLEATIRIGIHSHEKEPQRVRVDAEVQSDYAIRPTGISECFDYDHIYNIVSKEWPKRNHTALLESYVTELLEHIFRADARVVSAKVRISKPDIFHEAEAVGVEAVWTREDFERYCP